MMRSDRLSTTAPSTPLNARTLRIATASTAPAYSLAATLGFIVAVRGVGLAAPAVLLVSFLPMLCIAFAYNYMNRADPDAGTSFAWVTRAMGPRLGWLSGWARIQQREGV